VEELADQVDPPQERVSERLYQCFDHRGKHFVCRYKRNGKSHAKWLNIGINNEDPEVGKSAWQKAWKYFAEDLPGSWKMASENAGGTKGDLPKGFHGNRERRFLLYPTPKCRGEETKSYSLTAAGCSHWDCRSMTLDPEFCNNCKTVGRKYVGKDYAEVRERLGQTHGEGIGKPRQDADELQEQLLLHPEAATRWSKNFKAADIDEGVAKDALVNLKPEAVQKMVDANFPGDADTDRQTEKLELKGRKDALGKSPTARWISEFLDESEKVRQSSAQEAASSRGTWANSS
jgi:hypothetical protein